MKKSVILDIQTLRYIVFVSVIEYDNTVDRAGK